MHLRSPYDRQILRFAIPALGALAAEPLYVLVDTAVVGHLGRSQLAALGLAATVLSVLGMFNFLQYGTTAQVARATGAGEDLLGRPIRITTVDAGLVETEFSLVRFKGDKAKADAVYDGLTPVTPDEVADCVMFALTRPLHVNLDEIVIKAIAQSSGSHVVRKTT